MTADRKKALEAELEDLRGPKRLEIIEAIRYAKGLGDLSENAEYHQAREDQARLESRIRELEEIIRSAEVVSDSGGGDTVAIGSKVSVRKSGDKEDKNYTVVGAQEADMSAGKISNTSPIGAALFGKKKGDVITVDTPAGKIDYKIVSVS